MSTTPPAAALDRARRLLDTAPPAPLPGQLAVPTGPRIGSVCTGYGGLDDAVRRVLGGQLAFVSDPDPGASRILAHHYPDVPNLGDLTARNWHKVLNKYGPIDVVCGGYPCQPFSVAGQRKGILDDRHIWPYIARALGVLRPRIAIFENVANHLRLGFDVVLADLARLGFDVQWDVVRANEVGAPHQRRRLIIVATASDASGEGREGQGVRGPTAERGSAVANAPHVGLERSGRPRRGRPGPANGSDAVADPPRVGRGEGRAEPARQQGRPGAVGGGGAALADPNRNGREEQQRGKSGVGARGDADGRGPERWGRFAPAVARWEAATGRRAPWATDDRGRLNPAFVEWMMGLPAGHVTAVPGLTRTQQLKALGNGVVPQQAEAAVRFLLHRAGLAERSGLTA